MKNLFLIDGATGTGKSDLVRYVHDFSDDVGLVTKYSTREVRDYENTPTWPLDLTIDTNEDFEERRLDYTYNYGGERYGFYRADLKAALRNYPNVMLIVRSAELIRRLQNEYHFINVVPVYVYTDLTEVRRRLTQQHFDENQIEFRINRHTMAFEDYLKHPEIYREVIINNSSREDFHRLIDLTIRKYAGMPDIDDHKVFLLMSFGTDNPLLPDVAAAAKRAVTSHNPSLQCINLDDVRRGAYEISPEAKSQIHHSRLVIVDLTDNRPNVYYELGFVHGIGKDCILTCHTGTKPHFYPSGHHITYYGNATELETRLSAELLGLLGKDDHLAPNA